MLNKLFGWGKKKPEVKEPKKDTQFGRYSDNNKPVGKVARWTDADNLFKEKKYSESLDAFFEYLRDDNAENVHYERNGAEGKFQFYQGSRIVRGRFNNDILQAEVTLARMPQPSVPVMRRLLEMNFSLYYSRFALDNERLCMRFDTDAETASPGKLYYGLKELATKADKQDDLLVKDFSTLQTMDNEHLQPVPDTERELKYEYLQKWIGETLDSLTGLDPDKLSGGIAYILLALIYRIDYLISPEGILLNDLERIGNIYFKKDERPVMEKNRDMVEEFKKLKARTKEEITQQLFRSKYTFSITAPQTFKSIADSIHNANSNVPWYRDNGHGPLACQIAEYGIAYCQYSYSLPRPITELFHVFMVVNYPHFFEALGHTIYHKSDKKTIDSEAILARINEIETEWRTKYPSMEMKTSNIKFDNLVNFNFTFTTEIEYLNMDQK